ncbi:hypothetical protein MTP10_24295 [Nonomuraea sp. 3-1Str]|uniref:hypothetical protein n=1 Tax=Nonomuraea sp. 3-1Str TaxID=2929801 RepID=UPI0028601600|nr:hypothetical protein [Nonomuraea sp. 3-1Str]MDR8411844.1 hypothetical protein [Nonomuraea sp. 3-1Str]
MAGREESCHCQLVSTAGFQQPAHATGAGSEAAGDVALEVAVGFGVAVAVRVTVGFGVAVRLGLGVAVRVGFGVAVRVGFWVRVALTAAGPGVWPVAA